MFLRINDATVMYQAIESIQYVHGRHMIEVRTMSGGVFRMEANNASEAEEWISMLVDRIRTRTSHPGFKPEPVERENR
jgi:predicted LPLAT superfamily acyltransferase